MSPAPEPSTEGLPGAELVRAGISDLHAGRETPEAALVRMARPRLRAIGFAIPDTRDGEPAGHALYGLLDAEDPTTAHSRYNALVNRIVSFARAAEHAPPVDADTVRALARELAQATREPTTIYLTGGATAVVEGWRASTVDVDLRVEPESDEVLRRIATVKDELGVNIELVSPPAASPRRRARCTPSCARG